MKSENLVLNLTSGRSLPITVISPIEKPQQSLLLVMDPTMGSGPDAAHNLVLGFVNRGFRVIRIEGHTPIGVQTVDELNEVITELNGRSIDIRNMVCMGAAGMVGLKGAAVLNIEGVVSLNMLGDIDSAVTSILSRQKSQRSFRFCVIHGYEQESLVNTAETLYRAAAQPKSIIGLAALTKNISQAAATSVVELILGWLGQADPGPDSPAIVEEHHHDREVEVTEWQHSLTQTIKAERHRLWADEPVSMGGLDRGLAPFDFVLSGLGACTSMTLRMYANLKKWPLEGITVTLNRLYLEDKKVFAIDRAIQVHGSQLTEEQRQRLLEIANKCPVHKAMSGPITIQSRLV